MARSTGTSYPAINSTDLSKIKLNLPTKLEQQKIASFLTAVDNKIEQLSKKKALLGEYKKGLMQLIFSQAIRFKADDGSEFPDWEEKKLDDVSDCLDNRRQPLNGAERNQMKGDIPYYGANGIVDYVNDYIFDEELVLLAEDGGNFNDFSSKPIAQKISGKAWVNNHAHILKAKNIIATDFLFYSLVHKDIRRYIVGGSRAKLNKSDLLSIKTILPPLEEQTKIANFLSSIDNKIEQVGKQLDESKQFKKALLQQMFV
jgi:type I restriction enzyme S subunit